MAEAAAAPAAPAVPAEERGELTVRTRVLQRVAEQVSREVQDTVDRHAGLRRVRGGVPHAEVSLVGDVARVRIEVGCGWPVPVAAVAARVRDEVRERAAALSGFDVESVDVLVSAFPAEPGDRRRRVS